MVARLRQAALVPLLLVALAWLPACEESGQGAAVKEAAPDFELALFDGGSFRLSEQQGRAVVLNFFASWCTTCGAEAAEFQSLSESYADKGAVVIGVAVEDTEKGARDYVAEKGFTFATGLDASGEIKKAYGIFGVPMTYFIDKQGRINYVHAGVVTGALLQHELDKVL